jgi:hypothetical protein
MDVTLEFRGARVNEIDKMDDDYLKTMVDAGARLLMVGVESGSDRILKSFQKGISKEQVIRINRKLARYPQLTAHYNFLYGSPGETYEDLLETKDMAVQLMKENPQAYFGFGGDWKPIPGTASVTIAERDFGFVTPKTIDEWIEIDSSDARHKLVHSWYSEKQNQLIKLLQVACWVVDDKLIKETEGNNTAFVRIIRTMSRTYKPIAAFRLRHNFHQFMFEHDLWRWAVRILPRVKAVLG